MTFMTMLHIQNDQGSQDLDPGLQEKSMNPFCVSFGKEYTSDRQLRNENKKFHNSWKFPAAKNRLSSTFWNLDGMLKLLYSDHSLWYEISAISYQRLWYEWPR